MLSAAVINRSTQHSMRENSTRRLLDLYPTKTDEFAVLAEWRLGVNLSQHGGVGGLEVWWWGADAYNAAAQAWIMRKVGADLDWFVWPCEQHDDRLGSETCGTFLDQEAPGTAANAYTVPCSLGSEERREEAAVTPLSPCSAGWSDDSFLFASFSCPTLLPACSHKCFAAPQAGRPLHPARTVLPGITLESLT
jgi:hypothetical protein